MKVQLMYSKPSINPRSWSAPSDHFWQKKIARFLICCRKLTFYFRRLTNIEFIYKCPIYLQLIIRQVQGARAVQDSKLTKNVHVLFRIIFYQINIKSNLHNKSTLDFKMKFSSFISPFNLNP